MNNNTLQKMIDKIILKQYIKDNEEVAAKEYVMNKREKILKKHTSNVYPIKKMKKGGKKTYYYTKLDPLNRNHNNTVYAVSREILEDKIIAHYLNIEIISRVTIGDVLELAVEELNPDTAKRHKQLFCKHFSRLTSIKVANLNEEDIRYVLQGMINRGIKSKEFNNATSTLNKINDYCAYHHLNCINIRQVISGFRKYKLVGKHVFLSDTKVDTDLAFNEEESLQIIYYAFDNPDYHNLAIATLITTGLRAGELLALSPEDISLDKQRIRVVKTENTRTYVINDYCKDDSDRYVYLNDDAIAVLKEVMEKRMKDNTDIPFLFLNPFSDDRKLHLRAMDNRIRKIQDILGLSENHDVRSCHDCRRTYASIQYMHGVDIKTIQAQLGHSNPQQTWDYIKDVVDAGTRLRTLSRGSLLGA